MRADMKKLTERQVVDTMRRVYLQRLHEVIGETDVKDKRGNIVISPGLKVRHKKSQFEYTVSSVKKDPKSGGVVITLKSPELPRFTPQGGEEFVGEETPLLTGMGDPTAPTQGRREAPLAAEAKSKKKRAAESENLEDQMAGGTAGKTMPMDPAGGETVFVVDEKEFKKDYEVK